MVINHKHPFENSKTPLTNVSRVWVELVLNIAIVHKLKCRYSFGKSGRALWS